MNKFLPKLAIISPVYNEDLLIQKSANKLINVLDDLIKKFKISEQSFIYFVDDGSGDNSWNLISNMHKQDSRIKALKLSRNFGHQNAILGGLLNAKDKADCFITIDSDLQDDILVIEKFIDAHKNGYDIVCGLKENFRRDSIYKKYGNKIFYYLMKLFGAPIIDNHADFRFASKKVINTLSEFSEVNLFLRGIFQDLGFKTKTISYQIKERTAGESKYSFKKLISLAIDGISSFSIIPLRIIMLVGFVLFLCAIMVLIFVLTKLIASSTLTWLIFVALLVGSLQIISIGIASEYIGKIYKETKNRPRFIKDIELW